MSSPIYYLQKTKTSVIQKCKCRGMSKVKFSYLRGPESDISFSLGRFIKLNGVVFGTKSYV